MKKYWALGLQNAKDFLAYRLRVFLSVLSQFIAPLTMIWLFTGLSGSKFAGMTKEELTVYYVYTSILFLLMSSKADVTVVEAIQKGGLANYLIKPIRFWLVAWSLDFSFRLTKLILGLPFFLVLLILSGVGLSLIQLSLERILLIILTLVISFNLSFVTSWIVGLIAFWTEEVWGFQNLKEVSLILLGGVVLPYQFFPDFLQKIIYWTPFPYLINWPLRLGFSGDIRREFILACSWLLILTVLAAWMWKNGLRKYSALGVY